VGYTCGCWTQRARQLALTVLHNMASMRRAQLEVAKHALYAILRVLYTPASPSPALTAARHLAGLLLNNVASHVGARNFLFRAELRVKGALAAHGALQVGCWG
jgi:hypothetical protein